MPPHYKLVVCDYYSGLDWVGQAFEVPEVGYGEGVLFEGEVEGEALRKDDGLFEASIIVRSFPIKQIEVDMTRKKGWQVEEDIEGYKAKQRVWDFMDEWKGTKARKVHSELYGKEDNMYLPCPIDMVKDLVASFP